MFDHEIETTERGKFRWNLDKEPLINTIDLDEKPYIKATKDRYKHR